MRNAKPLKKLKDMPFTLRPRERLKSLGVEGLSNVELISIILGSGSASHSVLNISAEILEKFSLKQLSQASIAKLAKISGLGQISAGKILASLELGKRASQPTPLERISTPQDVLREVSSLKTKNKEYAVALYLNGRQELIHKQVVSIGSTNFNYLEPRDVFGPALNLPAPYIILAHNHPSGNPEASQDDRHVTKRVQESGKLLGIELIDHIVVGKNGYYSFREAGGVV